jgi:chemotaxis signal transduction protein
MLTQMKILDVALKYGYETPEAFAKAFKRFHGVTPIACRKSGTAKYLERSFPLIIKMKMLEGEMNMNNFGSPLQQILDDLDRKSANLYLCFNSGKARFAIPALQVSEITWTRFLFVNTEGKLCLSQRGHILPVIRFDETASFDNIIEGRQNILYCAPQQVPNRQFTAANGLFGLIVDGNPELKIANSVNATQHAKWPFVSGIGKFEDEELPIIQADELRRAMSRQIATTFEKADDQPDWQLSDESDAQKRLEFQAYSAELLARNASIEAAGGMERHKGTMVIACELHYHAIELAKIAHDMREMQR